MNIGEKIKQLRFKLGMTQEQLAEKLGLSAQSISKWENAVAMPDITLLPALAEIFGVSIDELFDLTRDQKLRRIENRLDMEEELAPDVFLDYAGFLQDQLAEARDQQHILSLLGHLYHHRMEADAKRVSRYARQAILLAPEKNDCQWLLQRAEGATAWDWNVANHAKVIEFYKEAIRSDTGTPKSPMPYYDLIDNLIADQRVREAEDYLDAFCRLPAHKPEIALVYRAYIALAKYDEKTADAIMEEGKVRFGANGDFLFELAQYYARKCAYDQAAEAYEIAYANETHRPRFCDALEGIAMIREIEGNYRAAAAAWERVLQNLHEEWGMTDEVAVKEAEKERNRLLRKAQ